MKQNDSKAAEARKNNSRGGRPRTKPEEQRTVRMTAYFDPEGAKYVREFCKEHGRSTSSFLYDAVMDCKIVAPLSVEEGADLRKVAGMANNVNQIARQANTYGYAAEEKAWAGLRDLLIGYLRQIREQCSQR